jgi:hypothetical protein
MIDFLGKYLILESFEQQLTDAIKNHQTVSLYYKGNKGTTNPKTGKPMGKHKDFTDSGLRYVIPVALGLHKSSGSVVLRALVTSKGVHTAGRVRPKKWRLFRLDRITSIYPHEDPNAIKDAMPDLYNQEGDDHMSMIYAKADYSGTTDTMPSDSPSISSSGEKRAWNAPSAASMKKVLKVPAKPAAPMQPTPPPVQPTPQQPIKQPSPQPVPVPQPAPVTPPVTPPIAPTVAPPKMTEPTEPIGDNQPKPLKEWHIWLNKILNT